MTDTLSDPAYLQLGQMLKARSGLQLASLNRAVVESRLGALARRRGRDPESLVLEAVRGGAAELVTALSEELLIGETYFFRDPRLFTALRTQVLPPRLAALEPGESLRIWSAACSTGQEAYSLAILVKDSFPQWEGRVEILGGDLNSRSLEQCRNGHYNQAEIGRGLSAAQQLSHFERDGIQWAARASLKSMVQWRPMNLCAALGELGGFDVVLLRNVLIYFDLPTRQVVLDNVLKRMRPGAWLFLGTGETLNGVHDGFVNANLENLACYRAKSQAAGPAAGKVS